MYKYLILLIAAVIAGCSGDESDPTSQIGNAQISWPSHFSITEGSIEPDLNLFEYQTLVLIESEDDDITCRVLVKPLDADLGATAAFTDLEAVSSNISFTSITDIETNLRIAQEAVAVTTDPDGAMRNSVNRWYYFSALDIPGDLSYVYSIGCASPMADDPETRSTVSGILNSVSWEFR